jgi:hypothetical protein
VGHFLAREPGQGVVDDPTPLTCRVVQPRRNLILRHALEAPEISQKTNQARFPEVTGHITGPRQDRVLVRSCEFDGVIVVDKAREPAVDAGLSSLASAEGHILWQVQAVLERLGASFSHKEQAPTNAGAGTRLLRQRAAALFGSKADAALPHIMVTFDTDMADDYAAVEALLKAGMQIARINCAHDAPEVWERMAKHVRKAAKATGLPCKVYLDLAGPKVRTVLLGKGRYKRRVKLKENETVWMAEEGATFNK